MSSWARAVLGWDVGGVQVKGALVESRGAQSKARTAVRGFEIWRGRERLPDVLREVAAELGGVAPEVPMALTMTAELSDAFRTKREGVLFVVDAVREAFPGNPVSVLDCHGEFVAGAEAPVRPLDFAATNWLASALLAAARVHDCIVIDVGSTTSDIVPIRGGRPAAEGHSDLTRLTAGELVYTGVLRSNPNTLAKRVPVDGRLCRVADEHFAIMADVYVLLGCLTGSDYRCPTPDGRGTCPEACAERLARLVCADLETLGTPAVLKVAGYLAERQLQAVSEGVLQVLSRWAGPGDVPVAPAGAGGFLARQVASRLGLQVLDARSVWGDEGVALPAVAAARLLAARLEAGAS